MTREDLIRQLKAAEKGSRGLDGRIAWFLGWRFNGFQWKGDEVGGPDTRQDFDDWPDVGGHWHRPGRAFCESNEDFSDEEWPNPPAWTTDVNAALALAEEEFPGVWWISGKGKMTSVEPLYAFELAFGADETLGQGEGATYGIAIVLAILDAKRNAE